MHVELGPFFKGVACGTKVNDAHEGFEFDNPRQRVTLFWYTAGLLAAGEYGVTSVNDIEFVQGLATQAPSFTAETSDEDESVRS